MMKKIFKIGAETEGKASQKYPRKEDASPVPIEETFISIGTEMGICAFFLWEEFQ